MAMYLGLDIGSGTSKGVIIKDGVPIAYHILPSGVDYRAVSLQLRDEILAMVGGSVTVADINDTVATGHG
ncbi:MAG: 2-hydroxyglutaryl-CoA dehydratase, partial [Smithellaceae bacterium]